MKEEKWNKKYFDQDFRGQITPFVSLGKTHLDFGCGFGYFAYLLSKDFPKLAVYGSDVDRKTLVLGKKKYKRKNLKFIYTLPKTKKFDSISVTDVIHHLGKNTNKTLNQLYDCLNKAGIFIVRDFRKVSKKKFKPWYERKKLAGDYLSSFEQSYKEHNQWTVKQFEQHMRKLGFITVTLEPLGNFWFVYIGKKSN